MSHSVSPAMYEAAFERLDLPWTYEAVDLRAGGLRGFVLGLDASWRGLSVTMPHKPDALTLGTPDEASTLVGGANTVVFADDGTIGVHNTDVPGVVRALAAHGCDAAIEAVIVGAGATARSVLAGLGRLGVRHVIVQVRDESRAAAMIDLAGVLGVAVEVTPIGAHERCDVLVSALPPHAADTHVDALVAQAAVVFDVAYDPWPTSLVREAERCGIVAVDGLDLVSAQAVDQIGLMCGASLPMGELRQVAESAVGR